MGASSYEVRCGASQTVFRKHRFATPVLDACYTLPPDSLSGSLSFCVLEAHMVTLHSQSGTAHSIAIPYKPRALWPMLPGVLLEGAARTDSGSGSLPPLFLLRRPLDSPVVVTAVDTDPAADIVAFGCILMASRELSLVLTHDAAAERHSLWRLQGTTIFPVWVQEAGSAAVASPCCFFSSKAAGGLLYLLQPEAHRLYVYDVLGREAAESGAPPLIAMPPLAVLPAASAQPVTCSFSSLCEVPPTHKPVSTCHHLSALLATYACSIPPRRCTWFLLGLLVTSGVPSVLNVQFSLTCSPLLRTPFRTPSVCSLSRTCYSCARHTPRANCSCGSLAGTATSASFDATQGVCPPALAQSPWLKCERYLD